ncbi:unnamed protein product [Pieris brassicae]|uniref:Uncharacterized protein n=1 Tax=Pieris brassicae TaxID=7116 RepID=A0A9P0TLP4_PIEBR|nr:unnamed protein product [Pieris brassicae]
MLSSASSDRAALELGCIIRKWHMIALAILHNIAIDIKGDRDVTYDDTENAPEEPSPTQAPPGNQAGQAA